MKDTANGYTFTYPLSFSNYTFAISVSNCDGIGGYLEDCIARIQNNSSIWLYSYAINFNGSNIIRYIANNVTYYAIGY